MTRRLAALTAAGALATATLTGAAAGPAAAAPSAAGSAAAAAAGRPWLAAGQSPEQRAGELVARMTLDEKIAMVHGAPNDPTCSGAGMVPANARLGIPALCLSDGPNGVGNGNTGVTAFPAAITTAAAWDTGLAGTYGTALGAEQAGKGHNVALAPTINILRTPLWGRAAETFTEDPYLNGQTALAEVRGIQSQHVIATPKHFVGNNQETGRLGVPLGGPAVDEAIPERALREIYYPGFLAATRQGGAGAAMCSYNQVNGQYACQNPDALGPLASRWDGFTMSDWFFAVRDAVPAATAGTDLEMPLGTHFGDPLRQAVQAGQVPMSTLDGMVRRILTSMFRVGLFDHPVTGTPAAAVSSPAHRALAQRISEQGSVLLRNAGGVLPLSRVHSLAVIGADAGSGAQIAEGGSGAVNPSELSTPVDAITARAGSAVRVTYAPGTLGTAPLPALGGDTLAPASGGGHGLLATYYPSADLTGTPVASRVESTVDFTGSPVPGLPQVWSARWTGTLTPPVTGDYRFSLTGGGAFRLWVGGRQLADLRYADFAGSAQPAPVRLVAGRPVQVRVEYSTAVSIFGGTLHLGWQPPDPAQLAAAVAAARRSDVAVVFADDVTGEGSDRTSLALPGDQNRLIEAVARANPRTVVVLNTGGPVLMPWLSTVAGVVEAWYPGQEDGKAVAALLFGDTDPSGRLPVTFPAGERQGPASAYPDLRTDQESYAEGILVGYRWYDATGQRPLFPFGFGLSYTTFRYGQAVVDRSGSTAVVRVRVTNTGRRAGAEVVQLYVGSPAAAREAPKRLAGYRKLILQPGGSELVSLPVARSALATWSVTRHRWVVVPGTYQLLLGSSSRDIRTAARLTVAG
jgi:beta-glucosidase